ncbi:MAG: pPIWI-associating nuclease domain-containing protein [Flavobacteriales bacterium]
MEIKKKYLSKYLHDIAILQIKEDYEKQGYKVFLEKRMGKFIADIVAERKDDKVVLEIKTGRMTSDRRKKLSSIADYIQESGEYRFMVVVATPPKEKRLEIENFEQILWEHLSNDIPDDLNIISTHSRIDQIIEIDLDEIEINGKSIFIKGDGVLNAELQYGSDGDQTRGDGFKMTDTYPFDFELTLEYDSNGDLRIIEVDKFKVDTRSFYE